MSAQILPFTPRSKASVRRELLESAAPAIIIFPGVRYERICDDADEPDFDAVPAQHSAPRH